MCGIVGWLSTQAAHPVDGETLGRMRDTMVHRGPDGAGLWVAPGREVALAFRRLAIVDLSATANQPMTNEDGTVQVVFNGEIYNHLELRASWWRRATASARHSDTEVIVHGYEEWGAAVRRAPARDVRDRDLGRRAAPAAAGARPGRDQAALLTRTRRGFLFASEIKALLAHPRGLGRRRAALRLPLSLVPDDAAPLTMFRGVFKMPAGCRGVREARRVDEGRGLLGRAARPRRRSPELRTQRQGAARVRRAAHAAALQRGGREAADVGRAVRSVALGRNRLSANVAVMSKLMDRPVRTFTVGFSDHEYLNELDWARRVAKHFKTDHHEVMVDEKAMREYLPSLVFSQDEPIADWVCIPLYFVSKLVRDSGTVVVQVGEGSDEQFAGYKSYLSYLDMYHRYWRPFSRLPRAARGAAAAMARGLFGVTDKQRQLPRHRRPRRPRPGAVLERSDGLPGVAQGAARGPEPPRAARRAVGDGGLGPAAGGLRRGRQLRGRALVLRPHRQGGARHRRAQPDDLLGVQAAAARAAADAGGQDRHVGLDRAARAVPRPPARRAHDEPADGAQARGRHRQGALQGGGAGRAARRRDRPAEDGLRRADGRVAARHSARRCAPS